MTRTARARAAVVGAAVAAAVAWAAPARAVLTSSEAEQIRSYVAQAQHADRVRALVARPDLSPDESAEAMAQALAGVVVDDRHVAYLEALVHGAPTVASRPVLAVATVRGLLARVDALYGALGGDVRRAAASLDEARLVYGFAAGEVTADPSMTDQARADVGKALGDHVTRNAAWLRLDLPQALPVARLRAQVAITLADTLPESATRRVEVADRLGLTGARRSAMIDLGLLVLDRTGSDDVVAAVRDAASRLTGAREGAEAVFVGDEHATFRARGAVIVVDGASGPLGEASSPWGGEADPPAVSALAVALARGLAQAEVSRALERRPGLRVAVEHDGGEPGVDTFAAMLAIDAGRTVDVAAARMLGGRRESVAWLADALGALAVFASGADATPAAGGAQAKGGTALATTGGLTFPVGGGTVSHVVLDPSGAASAFHVGGHAWRVGRDASGAVTSFTRDGANVALSMLSTARVAATEGSSWSGAGLVFAKLAGSPKVALSAGPKIRLVGGSVADAIVTPAPGDELTLDADVHADGGPAGVVVRAVPGHVGLQGLSLMLVPGTPPHAVLLVSDGSGVEQPAAPPAEIAPAGITHVRMSLKGKTLTATAGPASFSFPIPDAMAHGDLGVRAYPGVTVEIVGWKVGAASVAPPAPKSR